MKKSTLVMILALFGGAMLVAACEEEQATAPPPTQSGVCGQDLCATNAGLSSECQQNLNDCLAVNPSANDDECVAGAALFCGTI